MTDIVHSCRTPGSSWLTFLLLTLPSLAWSASQADYLSTLEQQVIAELNLARTQPQAYAEFVAELLPYYRGYRLERPGRIALRTQEGRAATKEAIRFLREAKPLDPLRPSRGMSLAAQEHLRDLERTGGTGHRGSDGSKPWDRLNRYGEWQTRVGENIDFGSQGAREVVISLLVDDGVRSRGHRKNIFQGDFRVVGVGCGRHSTYGTVCVMDLAADYVERAGGCTRMDGMKRASMESGRCVLVVTLGERSSVDRHVGW